MIADVIVRGEVPVLVRVTGRGVLLTPIAVVGNFKLVGASVTRGPAWMPVPVREMLWGLVGALSVITRFAVSDPLRLGVKVTEMLQVDCGATVLLEQVSVSAKSAKFVPVIAMVALRPRLPVLVRVTVSEPLAVPMT